MQDLSTKLTGDSLPATEWNQVPKEIQNVITALGISLTSTDLNQLGKAIAGYVANGNFYTDSGVADAYVLTQIGSKQAPTAYTDGFGVVFRPGNANTGACTVNVATLGVKSIKTAAGANPTAGALVAGKLVLLTYDAANGWFELSAPLVDGDTATTLSVTTLTTSTIKGPTSNTPPTVQDSGGTEVGQFSRAWVNFNGTGTVAIRKAFNVTSITDNGVGNYTVNFTNNLPDANYAVSCAVGDSVGVGAGATHSSTTKSISAVVINAVDFSPLGAADIDQVNVVIFD